MLDHYLIYLRQFVIPYMVNGLNYWIIWIANLVLADIFIRLTSFVESQFIECKMEMRIFWVLVTLWNRVPKN